MNNKKLGLCISLALATPGAQAAPLLNDILNDQTVFSHTYTTTGASLGNQTVWGNILANQDVTLGAGAMVSGNIQTRDLTTGDDAFISGNTTTAGDTTLGANARVAGDLRSVDLTVGANGWIYGDAITAADSTLGASATVIKSLRSGGAVTLGANAKVNNDVIYGTILTQSASAIVGQSTKQSSISPPTPTIQNAGQGVSIAQGTLNAMTGSTMMAPGDIAADREFKPGVYDVAGLLTTTAGVTLTLDAQNQDSDFTFNVSSYLSFGAGTVIKVINGEGYNTRVIWNSGGYTSIGAKAEIIGTILATAYVSTGAYSTVTGSGNSCGGVFSATSYVTVGANATVGSENTKCTGAISNISTANKEEAEAEEIEAEVTLDMILRMMSFQRTH